MKELAQLTCSLFLFSLPQMGLESWKNFVAEGNSKMSSLCAHECDFCHSLLPWMDYLDRLAVKIADQRSMARIPVNICFWRKWETAQNSVILWRPDSRDMISSGDGYLSSQCNFDSCFGQQEKRNWRQHSLGSIPVGDNRHYFIIDPC